MKPFHPKCLQLLIQGRTRNRPVLFKCARWSIVRNLTEEHQNLLRLLGPPYMRFYDVKYS